MTLWKMYVHVYNIQTTSLRALSKLYFLFSLFLSNTTTTTTIAATIERIRTFKNDSDDFEKYRVVSTVRLLSAIVYHQHLLLILLLLRNLLSIFSHNDIRRGRASRREPIEQPSNLFLVPRGKSVVQVDKHVRSFHLSRKMRDDVHEFRGATHFDFGLFQERRITTGRFEEDDDFVIVDGDGGRRGCCW